MACLFITTVEVSDMRCSRSISSYVIEYTIMSIITFVAFCANKFVVLIHIVHTCMGSK